jgi:uncharacterized membrane protein
MLFLPRRVNTDILTRRGKFFAFAWVAFIAGWLMLWRAAIRGMPDPKA